MPKPSPAAPIAVPAAMAALVDALHIYRQLPQHIRHRAVVPRAALSATEPSLSAKRLRAFDTHGQPCLYWHEYTLAALDFDPDDTPYVRVSIHEIVTAVRTQAGTWLQRTQRCVPEGRQPNQDSGFRLVAHFDRL